MNLYIAEKDTLAAVLSDYLAAGRPVSKSKYCLTGSDFVMAVTLGHTMELIDAAGYREEWSGPWKLDVLPILPREMRYRPIDRKADRLKEILRLCSKATRIIHCGDPDREGQYLIDLVIEHSGFKGEVFRWWPDDLSPAGIERSYARICPNTKYAKLGVAAKYRSWADWIVGINYTRAYTIFAQKHGHQGALGIGRVQTPTYCLVHMRCVAIETFKPVLHYGLKCQFVSPSGNLFAAELLLPEELRDENDRCLMPEKVKQIAQKIKSANGSVFSIDKDTKLTKPTLPYSLSALQEAAGRQWGYSLKDVLSGVQYLYEHLQCLTYPRTDCRYLSEGDFSSSAARIKTACSALNIECEDLRLRFDSMPACFNDKKTTAHTAIVPTEIKPDFSKAEKLSPKEKETLGIKNTDILINLYEMCTRRFVQQFMPAHQVATIKCTVAVTEYRFVSQGKDIVDNGWKKLEYTKQEKSNTEDSDLSSDYATLSSLSVNDSCQISSAELLEKKTSPPEYFTEGTLATAMANIARYVDDPKIRAYLRETDGIGTEATRTDIVEKLKSNGLIAPVDGKLVSTSFGRTIYPSIPACFKTPAMTAVWESALSGIAEGRTDHNAFYKNILSWSEKNINQLLAAPPTFQFKNQTNYPCPECGGKLFLRKGTYGKYWLCNNDDCRSTYKDFKKEPLFPIEGDGQSCEQCLKEGRDGVMKTKAYKGDPKKGRQPKAFLGCSAWPDCKNSIWDPN